jgi:hypothetical protein
LESANDLLSTHNIDGRMVPGPGAAMDTNKPHYVSVLGATGPSVALSSMLRIDKELLIQLHPLGSSAISDADLADWCRELNNQLVGRMKNKLLRYGIILALGLPVLLTGTDVTCVTAPDSTVSEQALQTSHGSIALTLETLVDPGLKFNEEPSLADGMLLEGAVALF